MEKLLLVSAAASLLATAAFTQTTVTTTTGTAGATVQIEPQYRTKIKSYVTEHKVRPVTTKEKIVVGGRAPADVELELGSVSHQVSLRVRVAGPSFRKSTDAFARSGPIEGGPLRDASASQVELDRLQWNEPPGTNVVPRSGGLNGGPESSKSMGAPAQFSQG